MTKKDTKLKKVRKIKEADEMLTDQTVAPTNAVPATNEEVAPSVPATDNADGIELTGTITINPQDLAQAIAQTTGDVAPAETGDDLVAKQTEDNSDVPVVDGGMNESKSRKSFKKSKMKEEYMGVPTTDAENAAQSAYPSMCKTEDEVNVPSSVPTSMGSDGVLGDDSAYISDSEYDMIKEFRSLKGNKKKMRESDEEEVDDVEEIDEPTSDDSNVVDDEETPVDNDKVCDELNDLLDHIDDELQSNIDDVQSNVDDLKDQIADVKSMLNPEEETDEESEDDSEDSDEDFEGEMDIDDLAESKRRKAIKESIRRRNHRHTLSEMRHRNIMRKKFVEARRKKLHENTTITYDLLDGNYTPWGQATEIYERINDEGKLEDLDNILCDMYPDGISETELNDLLAYDWETVYEWLGISDEDDNFVESVNRIKTSTPKRALTRQVMPRRSALRVKESRRIRPSRLSENRSNSLRRLHLHENNHSLVRPSRVRESRLVTRSMNSSKLIRPSKLSENRSNSLRRLHLHENRSPLMRESRITRPSRLSENRSNLVNRYEERLNAKYEAMKKFRENAKKNSQNYSNALHSTVKLHESSSNPNSWINNQSIDKYKERTALNFKDMLNDGFLG